MAKKAAPKEAPGEIVSIKGFKADLTCRGFRFEPGVTYTHDGAVVACQSGFHACTTDAHPLSVFEYYPPAGSRYFLVRQGGETHTDDEAKIASATITLDVEITIPELAKRAWEFVWSRAVKKPEAQVTGASKAASATGDLGAASATGAWGAASATGDRGAASATGSRGAASATGDLGAASATGNWGVASATGDLGAASATGDRGAASATGYQGAASATGSRGAASATGDRGVASATGSRGAASATGDLGAASATGDLGAASATGNWGAASATGDLGVASATGDRGAALASGYEGKVMGADGNALFAVERDDDWKIVSVASGIVGQDGIKAGVWYLCRGGKLEAA